MPKLAVAPLGDHLKSGTLSKLGGFRKNWLKRHFVLTADCIAYFENDTLAKEKGRIDLKSVTTVGANTAGGKAHLLNVVTPSRTYQFAASNDDERDEWIQAMNDALSVEAGGPSGGAAEASPAADNAEAAPIEATSEPSTDAAADASVPSPPAGEPEAAPVESSGADDAEADDDQEDVSGINAAELAELDPEGNSVLKKGWITKRGQLNKNWNKRFFVVTTNVCAYYSKEQDGDLKGGVLPETIEQVEPADPTDAAVANRPHVFTVSIAAGGRTHYFQTASPEDCDEWLAIFRQISGLDKPEHTAERLERALARRRLQCEEALKMLFQNFDANQKGSLAMANVLGMYKLLSLAPDRETCEADLAGIETKDGRVEMDSFVEHVLKQHSDSYAYEHRMAGAGTIKPLFLEDEDDSAGATTADISPEEGLATLYGHLTEDGIVAKSEAEDVFLSLLPKFDTKSVREAFAAHAPDAAEERIVSQEHFASFVLANLEGVDDIQQRITGAIAEAAME